MNVGLLARIAVGVAVSAFALVLVAQSADIPSALGRVFAVDPRWLVLPVLVVMVQLGIRSVRWAALLTAVGHRPVRARQAIGPLAVGYLGNTILPARLGEVVRIVLISRRAGVPVTPATASVVVERGVDLVALLTVATGAAWLSGATGWLPFAGVLGLLAAIGIVLPLSGRIADRFPARLPARARDILGRLFRAFAAVRPPVLARAWLLSLLAWMCDALVIWLCGQAVGASLTPGTAILIAAGAAAGAALPAAAGYLGTYELGALTMAAFAGVAPDVALQIALLGHAIAVLPLAIAGLVAVIVMAIVPPPSVTGDGGRPAEPVAPEDPGPMASREPVVGVVGS